MYQSFIVDKEVNRPAYTNMRLKMGSAPYSSKIKQQINLPEGTEMKDVRFYRRNSDWDNTGDGEGRSYKCSAQKTCLELRADAEEPAHWHFNHGGDVCGISKLGGDADTCGTETDRWFEAEATCAAIGARMCTESEVKHGALLRLAPYFHEYVMVAASTSCEEEKLEHIVTAEDCATAASSEHLRLARGAGSGSTADAVHLELTAGGAAGSPYGCYYTSDADEGSRLTLNVRTDAINSQRATDDGPQSICKNPLFRNVKFKATTEDTGYCEDTGGTTPVWVADTCDTGNGNGLGHKVLVSTGVGYATACIDEMIELKNTPTHASADGADVRIKPSVRCCASGTGTAPARADDASDTKPWWFYLDGSKTTTTTTTRTETTTTASTTRTSSELSPLSFAVSTTIPAAGGAPFMPSLSITITVSNATSGTSSYASTKLATIVTTFPPSPISADATATCATIAATAGSIITTTCATIVTTIVFTFSSSFGTTVSLPCVAIIITVASSRTTVTHP